MKDPYPRGGWEQDRERWPPHPSDSAWNQSWDQAPYPDYRSGPAPSFSYDWQHPVRPSRPQSIQAAAMLMYVGAGLSGLGFIYNLISSQWVAGYGAIPLNRGASGLVDVASAVSTIGSAFGSILGIALWVWMASAINAGKSWARTASTLFFVIGTLGMAVIGLVLRSGWQLASGEGRLPPAVLVAVLSGLVFWVLRLAIVVLLWRKESSAYFRAKAAGW